MNTDDVIKLASLARIEITTTEAESLTGDMNSILGYIKQIEHAHSAGTVFLTPVQNNIVRDDTASVCSVETHQALKENFPKERNGYLEINKIIQND